MSKKIKEELNVIKEEVEAVNEKLQELTKEELEKVNGGMITGAAQMDGAILVTASDDVR